MFRDPQVQQFLHDHEVLKPFGQDREVFGTRAAGAFTG